MTSEGWKELVGKEWASCVLHNLPFFHYQQTKNINSSKISIKGYQESASTWNWADFKERGCLKR